MASLIAALIGSIDRLARLRSSTMRTPSKSNLVVEFVGRHQRSAGGSVSLARDHVRAGFSGDALVAKIAGDHGLANERRARRSETRPSFRAAIRRAVSTNRYRACSASSGKIAATAPASHGLGSRAVSRIVCSVSSCSETACSARVAIQPNKIAATIQPHSMSPRRPIGVPGGMGPSIWMTSRAAAMAAAVARRCHASSRAAGETCPIGRISSSTPTPACAIGVQARRAWRRRYHRRHR